MTSFSRVRLRTTTVPGSSFAVAGTHSATSWNLALMLPLTVMLPVTFTLPLTSSIAADVHIRACLRSRRAVGAALDPERVLRLGRGVGAEVIKGRARHVIHELRIEVDIGLLVVAPREGLKLRGGR